MFFSFARSSDIILGMAIPNQGLICKVCGKRAEAPHKTLKALCDPCGRKRQVEYQRKYRERQKATPKVVVCKGCGKQFDVSANGRHWRCQECLRRYQAEYRLTRRERCAEHSRNYRERQGEAYKAKSAARYRQIRDNMTPEELAEFRKRDAEGARRYTAALKDAVYQAYGGWRCACCGEAERSFLTIDHVFNDGGKMRREGIHGHSADLYRWLRNNGYPDGFQVLCMNCQFGKHRNGVCPHQARCNDYPVRE